MGDSELASRVFIVASQSQMFYAGHLGYQSLSLRSARSCPVFCPGFGENPNKTRKDRRMCFTLIQC
jgi:hypothetical protein